MSGVSLKRSPLQLKGQVIRDSKKGREILEGAGALEGRVR